MHPHKNIRLAAKFRFVINASQEEEAVIGEELGQTGCKDHGLRMAGYEVGKKDW